MAGNEPALAEVADTESSATVLADGDYAIAHDDGDKWRPDRVDAD